MNKIIKIQARTSDIQCQENSGPIKFGRILRRRLAGRRGFGLNEVIGIAAGIIIAVVVVIPGLQGFAGDILDNLTNWWNSMAANVFATP